MAQTTATGLPTIGEVIRAWRLFWGLRSTELAEKAGVRSQYLSEIEHNRTANPKEEYLARLANALEVSLKDIYGRRMPREIGAFGSGVGLGVVIPRSRKGQQKKTDTGSQQRDQTIGLLVEQAMDEAQLTPEKRILAERLILENARSICQVLVTEQGRQGR